MNLDELLSRLKDHQIILAEDRRFPSGARMLILCAPAPEIPFGAHKNLWTTLPLEANQVFVEREEIEAVLRHLWLGSVVFFGDELDEIDPDGDADAATSVD